jgi:tetratricopeptide (TPR) repeat protein
LHQHQHLTRLPFCTFPYKSHQSVTKNDIDEMYRRLEDLYKKLGRGQSEEEFYLFTYYKIKGVVLQWLGDAQVSIQWLLKASDINNLDATVNHNLLLAYRSLGRTNEVLQVANRLGDEEFDFAVLKALAQIENFEVNEGLKYIEKVLTKPDITRDERVQLYGLMIYAYNKITKPKDIERICEILRDEYSDIPYSYKLRANVMYNKHQKEQAVQCLREGIRIEGNLKESYILRRRLYQILSESNKSEDIDEAIIIGSTLFNPIQKDDEIFSYIKLLFDKKRYSECLDLCRKIEESQGFHPVAKRVESIVLFNLKEYKECETASRQIVLYKAKDKDAISLLVQVLFLTAQYQEIEDVIAFAELQLSDDAMFVQLCSRIYYDLHIKTLSDTQLNKSFEYAQRAIELSDGGQQFVDRYIWLFFKLSKKSSKLLDDSYKLFGQELLRDYKTRYPDSKVFHEYSVPTDQDDLYEFMLSMIPDQAEAIEVVNEVYNQGRLPISLFSISFNKDYLETWLYLTHVPNTKIWLCEGIVTDQLIEDELISNSKGVILSLHSIFLLNKLQLLEVLHNIFSDIYISQTSVEVLRQIRIDMVKNAEDGSSIISINNGQISLYEVDAETHKKQLDEIDSLIEKIESLFKTIGHHTQEFTPHEEVDFSGLIGHEAEELILSRNPSLLIYSDDWYIRHTHKELTKNGSTYILPVLRRMRDLQVISNENYHQCIIQLLSLNYYLIPLEFNTIVHALRTSSYTFSRDVLLCIKSMKDATLEKTSVLTILLNLIRWIWTEPVTIETRRLFTANVVEIMSEHITRNQAIKIIEDNIDSLVSDFNPINKQELKEYLIAMKNPKNWIREF